MPTRWLVGRDAELDRLRRAAADAAAGSGALILLTGEAGIGKTSLLEAALARAPVTSMWGTCRQGSGVPGLWPWVEILRAGQEAGLLGAETALAALSRQEPDGAAEVERFAAFDAVNHTLRVAAAATPLALILDDLQWADAGTLRLLEFLIPDLRRSRLLVLGAYRDDEVAAPGHPTRALLGQLASRATVLPVPRLDPVQVAELVTRLRGGAVTAADAAAVHRRTGGNPFFVEQVSRTGGEPSDPGAGIRETVRRRLALLTPSSAELVEVAAVVGRASNVRILAAAADRLVAEVLAALDAAVAAQIIEPAGPGLMRFTHDLFRETVYADIDSARRARLHGAVAEALEAITPAGEPSLAAELARHHVQAATVGDPAQAIPYLRRAAERASAALAYEEAGAHLIEGVGLAAAAGDHETRLTLLLDLADASRRGGELDQARQNYLEALGAARTASDAAAMARAALGLHHVGAPTWSSHAEVIDALDLAIAARDGIEDAPTARLLAALARELTHGPPDRERALTVSDQAVTLARKLDDPATLAHCLLAKHDAVWAPGSTSERLAILDEVATAAAAAGDPVLGWEALFGRFVALLELGDPTAFVVFLQVVDATDRLGRPHYRWLLRSRQAVLAVFAGRAAEAEALLDEIASAGERLGEPDRHNVIGNLRLQLGMLRGGPAPEPSFWAAQGVPAALLAPLEALSLLARGDAATAADTARPWVDIGLARARGWQILGAAATLAEIAAAARDRPLCERVYGLLHPHPAGLTVTGGAVDVMGPVSLYLGLLAGALGRPEEALDRFDDALACAERMNAPPWIARIRYEIGRVLAGRNTPGDQAAADQHLRAAAQIMTRLGLPTHAERAHALAAPRTAPENVFRREGEVWTLGFAGELIRLPDAKGLHDIARLLAAPGRDVPAAELLGTPAAAEAATGADPIIDDTARIAYRRRLADLDDQIAEADEANDLARATRARAERDALVDALAKAYGRGGRPRRLGDASERARKAVTARIRDSLRRIEASHPQLGAHLRESIATGTVCAYRPIETTRWRL